MIHNCQKWKVDTLPEILMVLMSTNDKNSKFYDEIKSLSLLAKSDKIGQKFEPAL